MERISWMKAAKRDISITSDIIVGFPGETEQEFEETLSLLDECRFDAIFGFKYSPRPNTPAVHMEDAISDAEKSRRLTVLQEKQREIQRQRNLNHINQVLEVMVEGKREDRGQWMGRSSQNKVVNFTVQGECTPGTYTSVRITSIFPNSLVGELVV
jgi:tRNA-2-methylthio-N6-dimethylallyladenosine synthase